MNILKLNLVPVAVAAGGQAGHKSTNRSIDFRLIFIIHGTNRWTSGIGRMESQEQFLNLFYHFISFQRHVVIWNEKEYHAIVSLEFRNRRERIF